jgi:nucleotide-binding universal stress UspA family protein
MLIKENQSILIPIDFSKQSLVAIAQTYNLAKYTNSKIILMHVSPKSATENALELQELAKKTQIESGQKVDVINLKGDIYELIDKKAAELNASLIVIGLDTQKRFRNFLGTNPVSKFIKDSPCPVITIRSDDNRNSCKNIIMPFDMSAESREKVPIVVQLAQYYKADIRIVSVFSPGDESYENALLPYLNQVKKFIKEKGVACSNKSIPSKDVAHAVIEYANKVDGDLIVQMNKKDIGLGDIFSGAVSKQIVDTSNIPVMSINPMKRESISSGIH